MSDDLDGECLLVQANNVEVDDHSTEFVPPEEISSKDIFIFNNGSVVFWNIPQLERQKMMEDFHNFETDPFEEDDIAEEKEAMLFGISDTGKTHFKSGEIKLNPNTHSESEDFNQQRLEKYAFSNAIAASVKLGMLESKLDRIVDSIGKKQFKSFKKSILLFFLKRKSGFAEINHFILFFLYIEVLAEDLRNFGEIKMDEKQVLMKTGEIFSLRNEVNLSSDLLDTPDFYWDRDDLERLYLDTCSNLKIKKRTSVMNERLNNCIELMSMVTDFLNHKHSSRLEWYIIILIMIEIGFEAGHFIQYLC